MEILKIVELYIRTTLIATVPRMPAFSLILKMILKILSLKKKLMWRLCENSR